MKRAALYSSSRSRPEPPPRRAKPPDSVRGYYDAAPAPPVQPPPTPPKPSASPGRLARTARRLWLPVGIALVAALLLSTHLPLGPAQRVLTQKDIDAAVLHTLNTKTLPSTAARAYDEIRPSVVRVDGLGHDHEGEEDTVRGTGSGVVILDSGVILTNLHVVSGANRLKVLFYDGTESDAQVVKTQPENDLAVIQVSSVPDDLIAATLRSTKDLAPGDEVIAVGFPFGIGPSVSAGVVSGLRREFRSPEGQKVLTNLIQFDAAANPGSSGGPLVTADGHVVGIVTAILNPNNQGVFAGIGFAVPIENAAAAVGLPPF
jgi:S1-C subfamily serine protease